MRLLLSLHTIATRGLHLSLYGAGCLSLLAAFLMLTVADSRAQSVPQYYAAAEGKRGAALRDALHAIIRGHTVLPYSHSTRTDTRAALKHLDRDLADASRVFLIYAPGDSDLVASFGLSSAWNREHLWPDSYGLDGTGPAYTDLHHLRACDASVNTSRGNKHFDVTHTNGPGYRFPAHAEAPLCSTDSDSWEPPAAQKGNIARALLYLAIRYNGAVPGEPRLQLTDDLPTITTANSAMGRFTTLLRWHAADPVDADEARRNQEVFALYQGNRNPFVDRPEFAAAAFIPPLQIAAAGTNLLLSWTNDYTPTLVVASATTPTGPWQALTSAPTLTNSTWRLQQPPGPGHRFYRLELK
jgi:endonuclease I